MSEVITMWFS